MNIISILVIVCLLFSFAGRSTSIKISPDVKAFILKLVDQFGQNDGEET